MEKKAVSGIMLMLLLTSVLPLAFRIQPVEATGGIFIRADGAIDPPTVPIRRDGDVYTFTGNIFDEIVVEKSNIIVDGNGYTLQGSGSESGFHLEGINNVTIQKLNIQSFTFGIYIHGSFGNTISGNNIINNDNGVHLSGSSNNTIFGNNITNSYLRGIELYSSSEFNTISGNNMTNNFRSMFISGSSGNTISGNILTKSDYDGICVYWAPSNTISGNTITNCNYDGICLYWSFGNTISGNTMTDNYHSICLYSSSDNIISGNTITNSSCGIDLYSSSEFNTISGNNIINNDNGVHLYSSSGNTISGNTMANNHHGVHLYSSSNNTIFGNNMIDNYYGIYFSDSSANTISGNIITNNNYAGIYLYDSSEFNTISGNTISDNDYAGIYFYWSNNNTISGNTITNNFRGIFFWSSHGNIISGNTNTNNYDGVCVHGADAIISGNTLTNNEYGIALHSAGTIISGNNITNNNCYGISVYDSAYNMIFHNNLINKTNQIRLSHSNETWDDCYPSGGNYWSDYTGIDEYSGLNQDEPGSDGIGDTPYIIDENNQDNYPLMAPIYTFDAGTWKGTHYFVDVVSNSTVSDFYFNPSEEPFLRSKVTGPDGTSGFCRVTVPKGLLGTPDVWTVKVNDQIVTPNIMEDGENTYLYFTYSHSTKIVEIRGREAKLEFPMWIPILLMLIVLAVAVALYKRRLSKTPIY